MAVAVAAVEPAVLTNGEIRSLTLRNLTIGPWQRRPNERTMDWPFIVWLFARFRLRLRIRRWVRIDGLRLGDSVEQIDRRGERFVDNDGRFWIGHRRTGKCRPFGRRDHQRGLRLLAPRHRHFGLLIFVVRVAGGAACLLHLVFNHRDDRMVRNAALARTVVVQNVTEPKPALLHELPRSCVLSASEGGTSDRRVKVRRV